MKITNVHERTIKASAEQLEAIVADLDGIWPTQISPAPYPDGELLRAGTMRWQEFYRSGALRAFRVVSPPELGCEHWFEVERVKDGTVLRHTIDGEALVNTRRSGATASSPYTTWCSKRYSITCSRSLNERVAQESHPGGSRSLEDCGAVGLRLFGRSVF